MNDVVLASNNAGKLREFKAILSPLGWQLRQQSEFSIDEAEETGLSFIENAILKARHATKLTGLPALADDSGLVVPALNGEPGIYSARYAGLEASDSENVTKLLAELGDSTARSAFFVCALAYVEHCNDPTPIIAEGRWHGDIAHNPQGVDGFGYDPVFFLPALNKTAAELDKKDKNHISHRAKAIEQLLHKIKRNDC